MLTPPNGNHKFYITFKKKATADLTPYMRRCPLSPVFRRKTTQIPLYPGDIKLYSHHSCRASDPGGRPGGPVTINLYAISKGFTIINGAGRKKREK
jgi:hypothetical protein